MKKFLIDLQKRVEAIRLPKDVPAEAAYEMQKGDKVVGTLSIAARKHYMDYLNSKAVWHKQRVADDDMVAELIQAPPEVLKKPEDLATVHRHVMACAKHRVIEALWQVDLLKASPKAISGDIVIGRGWKVIVRKRKPNAEQPVVQVNVYPQNSAGRKIGPTLGF